MYFFKNKYYKLFPLSIFITKCDEETVIFKNKEQIKIHKIEIKYDEKKIIDKNYYLLCSNNENFSINKKSSIENLLSIDNYISKDNNTLALNDIKTQLLDYTYTSYNVYNEKKESIDFKIGNDFIDNYEYNFYFYKKLNFKNIKFKLDNNDFKVSFKSNITTKDIFDVIEEYKKNKNEEDYSYSDIFEKILNKICNDFNAENFFLVINGEEINYNDDNITKEIYKNFISSLLNNKEINVELKKSNNLIINEVLLSNDLTKIYKIDSDKGKELKDFLTTDYSEKKYSELQNALKDDADYKNIKIENGEEDIEIDDISNVTIIITADPDKKITVPKQCTINFKAGNNLYITDSTKYPDSKDIEFSNSGITTETDIVNYINKTYPDIKDKCTITKEGDVSGKFKDGTVVAVTINNEIPGITSAKDPNKVYVNVKFKVSDTNKFKLNGKLATSNNFDLELEKDKKITDLLNEITKKLNDKNLKEGYKIELNNSAINDNETELVDGATYIITLDNNDTNFVVEIKKEDPKGKGSSNNNDNSTKIDEKKGCYSKKSGKKCSGGTKNE